MPALTTAHRPTPDEGVEMTAPLRKKTASAAVIDYLIVGGGPAGATAADTLRREGAGGSVAILSAEESPPYHRQRLSKGYLVGSSSVDEMFVHPLAFYAAQKIDLRLGVRVASVDTARRRVLTAAGEEVRYRQLLLAPGATPRRSSAVGCDLRGIHYLRDLKDADSIREAASRGLRAVVVGASYLGMEVAFTLRTLGLSVTLIEAGSACCPTSNPRKSRPSSRAPRLSAGSSCGWATPWSASSARSIWKALKREAVNRCPPIWRCSPQA